jgi:capsular polysaccharide biosynthesis protein
MYLALLSFAIFCGLVAVLILEWLDTIIRRPHDVENTLGLATFGVIPDLHLQPIENTLHSKRGI